MQLKVCPRVSLERMVLGRNDSNKANAAARGLAKDRAVVKVPATAKEVKVVEAPRAAASMVQAGT